MVSATLLKEWRLPIGLMFPVALFTAWISSRSFFGVRIFSSVAWNCWLPAQLPSDVIEGGRWRRRRSERWILICINMIRDILIPNLTSDQIFFSFFLSSYFLPVLINSLFRSTLHMQIWRSGKLLAEYSNMRLLSSRSIHVAKYLQGSSVQPEQASCETKKIKKNSTTSSTNFSSTAFVVSTSRFVQRKRTANNTTARRTF